MKMKGVLSGWIKAFGWENGVLEVWFLDNRPVAIHYNVPYEAYENLFNGSDFGRNYMALCKIYPPRKSG
ncbi:hypothetical protein J40TS1_00030 [Paenibacillus montaniterrae]|uniref:Uncharacterized protein n=1 Tax=Paenibacillus montaniterrae TaxID=429341 RepID=A0A920CUV0_9BACL|nr:hypothetical protein [Paenibacillus montaniterrae]GIP14361.1 hypothetical protein J40TS1_00030 [Paenibacillus montaniterrae]